MDLLLFLVCTNLKKPIFHQIVQKFTDFRDDFKSELNMGDRRISRALSDGHVLDRNDPLFGVGIHTANGGKPLGGEETRPEWSKRVEGLQNRVRQSPSRKPTRPSSRRPLPRAGRGGGAPAVTPGSSSHMQESIHNDMGLSSSGSVLLQSPGASGGPRDDDFRGEDHHRCMALDANGNHGMTPICGYSRRRRLTFENMLGLQPGDQLFLRIQYESQEPLILEYLRFAPVRTGVSSR